MNDYRSPFGNREPNGFNAIVGVLALILGLFALFFIARFIYTILWYLSPVFLIGALIVDRKGVINYGKWIVNAFKKDTIYGVVVSILSIFGFPIVTGFLFGKALLSKRIKKMHDDIEKREKGELIEYEEIDNEPLKLKEFEKTKEQRDQ
ncbi:MAG: hypothetical protein AAFO07_11545 [Bacteroidota bacterium]